MSCLTSLPIGAVSCAYGRQAEFHIQGGDHMYRLRALMKAVYATLESMI